MTAVLTMPRGPWTRADLAGIPDDGHRYELIDGLLLVTPAPRVVHQDVVANLLVLLKNADRPDSLKVLTAPVDVVLSDDTVVQPDLIVAPRAQFTDTDLPGAPLLAVEILSPSTRRVDQILKRDRYRAAGIAAYWIVDPDEPSIEVLELVDGDYELVARASGGEVIAVVSPYSLQICPSDLVR